MKITSKNHPYAKKWKQMIAGERQEKGVFWSDHFRIIQYALDHGLVKELIFPENSGSWDKLGRPDGFFINEEVRSFIGLHHNHMALIQRPCLSIENYDRILLIDSIRETGPLGTMIRTARSFGFDGVILTGTSIDSFDRYVSRAAQANLFALPVLSLPFPEAVSLLKREGCTLVTPGFFKAGTIEDLPSDNKIAVMISAAGGTSPEILSAADLFCRMDFNCADPVLVSLTASILMHACRNLKGEPL